MSVFTKPSYYALAFTGLISLFVVLLFISNYSILMKSSPYKVIKLLSLIGILIGIHGLLHLGLETAYNFNPIELIFSL